MDVKTLTMKKDVCQFILLGCLISVFVHENLTAPTTDSRIVSKLLTAECRHGSDIKNHGDNWSIGNCDNNICYHYLSGKYVVQERCRPLGALENPDTSNCGLVADDNLVFPGCCPKLQCGERAPLTTISPSVCMDLASDLACTFWKNETLGCQQGINERLYNFTRDYCRSTCGFCS